MAVSIRTTAKVLLLTALRRNPVCSITDALRGCAASSRLSETVEQLMAGCRLLETDNSGLKLWDTPVGSYWSPAETDREGLAVILAEQECGAYKYDEASVRPGDVVLDCGANIGAYSRNALRLGARFVVAIEPTPTTAECLRRNLAPEIASGCVAICEKGLWNTNGSLTLIIDPHNAGGNSFVTHNRDSYEGTIVPVATIDSIVEDLALDRVDFIKMDIEAAERPALEGAHNTLARFGPRLAIAVEHTQDRLANAQSVAAVVKRARADYEASAGFCYISAQHMLLPEVLYFH